MAAVWVAFKNLLKNKFQARLEAVTGHYRFLPDIDTKRNVSRDGHLCYGIKRILETDRLPSARLLLRRRSGWNGDDLALATKHGSGSRTSEPEGLEMEDFRNLRKRAREALEIAAKMRASADQDAWLKVADEFFRLADITDDTERVLDQIRAV